MVANDLLPTSGQFDQNKQKKKAKEYRIADIKDLRKINQIALLYWIITKMGDKPFTPEDVNAKMSDRIKLNAATIHEFLIQCFLDGFLINERGKFKNRAWIF